MGSLPTCKSEHTHRDRRPIAVHADEHMMIVQRSLRMDNKKPRHRKGWQGACQPLWKRGLEHMLNFRRGDEAPFAQGAGHDVEVIHLKPVGRTAGMVTTGHADHIAVLHSHGLI